MKQSNQIIFLKKITNPMKGGEIATMIDNAIVIDKSLEKKKKLGFWVLVTGDRRRKEQNKKKQGGRKW